MASVEKSIEVNVPVSTAYNQWTQFEDFPRFMEGVEEVRQVDDKRLQWHADIGGKDERWEAEITSQVPDEKIAWRSISGAENAGIVTFHPIDGDRTEVHLRIEYQPEGIVETAGDLLGLVSSRVEGDLERFKSFIESRGAETGAWRGHIHAGEVKGEGEAKSSFEGEDRGTLHRLGREEGRGPGDTGPSRASMDDVNR
jgi:uncharacterized membrane protein